MRVEDWRRKRFTNLEGTTIHERDIARAVEQAGTVRGCAQTSRCSHVCGLPTPPSHPLSLYLGLEQAHSSVSWTTKGVDAEREIEWVTAASRVDSTRVHMVPPSFSMRAWTGVASGSSLRMATLAVATMGIRLRVRRRQLPVEEEEEEEEAVVGHRHARDRPHRQRWAMSLAWGFTYADIGLADDPADRSVQLTHADAICWLTPAVTSYTYDTLIDEYPGALDEPAEEDEEGEGGEEGAGVEEEENGASRPLAPLLAALLVAASLA